MTDERKEYIKSVKKILNEHREASGKTIHALYEELKPYNMGLNEGTLRNTFNYKKTNGEENYTLDFFCILTLCKHWKIDVSEILEPSKNEDMKIVKEHPLVAALNREGKFHALTNEKYRGDYTGYIVGPTPNDEKIGVININFEMVDGKMEATLTRKHPYYEPTNENMEEGIYTMKGIPLCSDLYKMIFIVFSNDMGDCQFLFFGYEDYRAKRGMVYRQGLSITGEAPTRPNLVAQNFLLFKKGIPKSKEKYIPGLLSLPQNTFCVAKEEVDKLVEEHEEVKEFMNAYRNELEDDGFMVYPISEDSFLKKARPKISQDKMIQALLLLKSALDVPQKTYYQADTKYSSFGINYMLRK